MIWLIVVLGAYFAMLIAIAVAGMRRLRNAGVGPRRPAPHQRYGRAQRRLLYNQRLDDDGTASSSIHQRAGGNLGPESDRRGSVDELDLRGRKGTPAYRGGGNALTLPESFEARFCDSTGILHTGTTLITFMFVIFYVSSGLVGRSKLLETESGLDPDTGVVVTLIATAPYTLIGGFMAVSRTRRHSSDYIGAG